MESSTLDIRGDWLKECDAFKYMAKIEYFFLDAVVLIEVTN